MLDRIFFALLRLDLAAMFAVLLVLGARLIFKNAPKRIAYALWGIVLLRLLIPFSVESRYYIAPDARELIPVDIVVASDAGADVQPGELPTQAAKKPDVKRIILTACELVWLGGIGVFAAVDIARLAKLRAAVRDAKTDGCIVESANIKTAFVLGIFRPKICIPSGLSPDERRMITEHELTHLKRGDHIIRAVAYTALVLHWYNPAIWLAFTLAMRDMEMACDEAVIRRLGDIREEYGSALLRLASGERMPASPPAFGDGELKERIVNLMKHKKPSLFTSLAAVVTAALILTACTLTGGRENSFSVELPDSEMPVFRLNITLPDGWSIDDDAKKEPYYGMYGGTYRIYDNGEYVGFIGCGSYPDYSLESEPEQYPEPFSADYYKAVYPELRLPAHYFWEISPEPLKRTKNGETALAVVYKQIPEDEVSAAAWETLEKLGIVSYDDDKHVYVMVELEPSVGEEVQRKLAESISLE